MDRTRLLLLLLVTTQLITVLYIFFYNRSSQAEVVGLPSVFQLGPVASNRKDFPTLPPTGKTQSAKEPQGSTAVPTPAPTPVSSTTPRRNDELVTEFIGYQKLATYLSHIDEQSTVNHDKPYYFLVIGILSAPNYREKRDSVRDTWLNYLKGTDMESKIHHRFIVGYDPNPVVQDLLRKENEQFHDLLLIPQVDSYRNVSYKTEAITSYAAENLRFDWLLKIDDDSFIRLDRLVADLLMRIPIRSYMGCHMGRYIPHRDPNSAWYVSTEEVPDKYSNSMLLIAGPGYVLSQDLARFIANRVKSPEHHQVSLEDVNTMILASEAGIYAHHLLGWNRFHKCEEDMYLSHYVVPANMRLYYQRSRNGARGDILWGEDRAKMCG